MTDLRQAAQMALQALEGWEHCDKWVWPATALEQAKRNTTESFAALRTALQQPQQAEQVHGDIRALKYRIHELEGEVMGYKRMLDVAEAASQQKPLTDEEIDQLLPEIVSGGSFTVITYGRAVARAVEAKIKEGT